MDKPTAHSLGKFFQKRLVGRPGWIQDGGTIAILRKSEGHNENKYSVEILAPGQTPNPEPFETDSAAGKDENFPYIPRIPRFGRPGEGNAGNMGKVGNVSVDSPQQNGSLLGSGARETPAWRTRI
jgi:hypothetical protein